ncbi:PTS system cellobiose-specific IIC component [Breznakia sp. PF5-3]|uniref:PTS sugar transporter subunit IIC n=1 Tax=unclassified Breznakia TaxID=2623764 RepID=UPI0024073A85|nr:MULTISPECIES: PTS transporter subunit EIIC [unclassified Breznakia]MDF9824534.1 PTS system cellobiose-specific IIC component [Breznakia sp. PM6-1]MDF9835320.1 PTS system cellobiose-specific IIC component [Breznakia sp. PF5-3]MDF9837036.1 PTS system cellobiose-specific IIC component [Breznakia sp. PFB2-8]MDF9858961.1 PTS system cellobiose-specific IIC component [Breznakia sp. PH5-24]
MTKFIDVLNEKLVPIMNKVTNNIYIQALQAAITQALPMIFVGSLASIIMSLLSLFPNLEVPDLSPLNTFSFGLFAVFISFLTPYNVLEKKKMSRTKVLAGLTGISLFFMFIRIDFSGDPATITFGRLGAEGMLCAIISGLFVAVIMKSFYKFSLFKEGSSIPDFVRNWFNNVIPIFLVLFTGFLLIYIFNLDIFELIVQLFSPMLNIGQSFAGFVLLNFVCVIFYSFGVSPWVLVPIIYGIMLPGIAENAELVAKGLEPININTQETVYFGWVALGGLGTTLPLNIMMLFSKAKGIKAIGKACIFPSLLNINEPIVFGAPIVFNPFLMIPMWIVSIVVPAITYVVLSMGLVAIPSEAFFVMGVPLGVSTWLISPSIASIVLLVVIFIVSYAIYFPFFKVYENQKLKEERSSLENESV